MPTVQRTITLLLQDDPALRETLDAYNAIQRQLSPVCYNDGKPLGAVRLQERMYYAVKGEFSAQMTCSAIRMVAGAYRSARSNGKPAKRPFRFENKSALFLIGQRGRDATIRSDDTLSIWTVGGRKNLSFTIPAFLRPRFEEAVEYDSLLVIQRKGRLVGKLVVSLAVPEPQGDRPCGIDRGEINAVVAVDADDQVQFRCGRAFKQRNRQTRKHRARLQKLLAARKAERKDTRSVRRSLKRLGAKQSHRSRDFARTTARKLIASLPAGSVLTLEDLSIPRPLRTKRSQQGEIVQKGNCRGKALRRRLSRWTYATVERAMVSLAEMSGIRVVYIDPAYTSKTCSRCGERGIRKRHRFVCPHCGLQIHADVNAGTNIRTRGLSLLQSSAVGSKSVSPEALKSSLVSLSDLTLEFEGKPLPLGSGH